MNKNNIYTLLREPLLHFLIIGAGLFYLFAQIGGPEIGTDNRIVITQADVDRLAAVWLRRRGRPPSTQEREQQLDHYIREQILYREAKALGLDQDDVIVRRRLAQKMEYLFDDLSLITAPSEAELRAFLAENTAKYMLPASISFRHIYLDPNVRGQGVYEDANLLLTQLQGLTSVTDITGMGDRSLLPHRFADARENELANLFGKSFATQILAQPIGSWRGPLASAYGLHLVYVNSRTDARLPPLAAIRARVANAWRAEKEREANEMFYQGLAQRYEIVIKGFVVKSTIADAKP